MFSSCRRLFQHRRSSSNQHKARSRLHKIDRDAAAARQVPGHHYAKRYHMIYLPDPASSYDWYYFSARTGRRHSRPSVLTRPPVCLLLVRRASPGSSPRRSPLLPHRRRAGAGRWGLLVFAPSFLALRIGVFYRLRALRVLGRSAQVLFGAAVEVVLGLLFPLIETSRKPQRSR